MKTRQPSFRKIRSGGCGTGGSLATAGRRSSALGYFSGCEPDPSRLPPFLRPFSMFSFILYRIRRFNLHQMMWQGILRGPTATRLESPFQRSFLLPLGAVLLPLPPSTNLLTIHLWMWPFPPGHDGKGSRRRRPHTHATVVGEEQQWVCVWACRAR